MLNNHLRSKGVVHLSEGRLHKSAKLFEEFATRATESLRCGDWFLNDYAQTRPTPTQGLMGPDHKCHYWRIEGPSAYIERHGEDEVIISLGEVLRLR